MRLDWGTWLAGVVMCAALGVASYFALWLCGMPAQPNGYAGAALLFVALWHYVYIIGKAVKSG